MSRLKNHLNPEFVAKIRGILYDNQDDEVTPAEFVLYLLETHEEDGLYRPITRDQLSMKVKGREHYFSEIYSKEKPNNTLPHDFAASLANLTRTEPFFWQGTHYKLAQAKGITIDMTRDIKVIPDTKVSSVQDLKSQKPVRQQR
jgi:hypothetical protein